ncbi:MAG: hypothetical protein GXZ04_00655 [Clostridiales bacterium]|nr:hypothetical protein [Clostridiales bacterium]
MTWIFAIVLLIAHWLIFEKANQPGWKSLIPFYNSYTTFKIAWGQGWLFLLILIPVVNIVVVCMMSIKLAHSFGKSTAFGWGLVFLPGIFHMILGFGSAQYQGPDV